MLESGYPAAIAGHAGDILRIARSPSQPRRDLRDLVSTYGLAAFTAGLLGPELPGLIERADSELPNALYRALFDRAGYARLAAYLSLLKLEDPERARREAGTVRAALAGIYDWRRDNDLYLQDLMSLIDREILSTDR